MEQKIAVECQAVFTTLLSLVIDMDIPLPNSAVNLLSPRELSGPSLDLDPRHRLKTETWVIGLRMSMCPKLGQSEFSRKILRPLSGSMFFPLTAITNTKIV